MKPSIQVLLTVLLLCTYNTFNISDPEKSKKSDNLNKSGYTYTINISKINSKYSEIACTTFRNKLVLVSSKKIGAFGNGVDPLTNEPYTDLFCTDILAYGELSQPLLFSRILNTKNNEGQVAFSPDEHTIYYTRSRRDNSLNYQIFRAELEKDSYGNWINHQRLNISNDNYSIENPHVTEDGKFLYFASNMNGGYGGFDLYRVLINNDGSLGTPENLGKTVNSRGDEKYPHTAKNGKELFFSSTEHNSLGGFDIFMSNAVGGGYDSPKSLGSSINSEKDEIAFLFIDNRKGVFSSNRDSNKNAFNLYRFQSRELYKVLKGIVISEDEKILPNSIVILLDHDGNEIERQITNKDASYNFKIKPFKDYQLKVLKEGYEDYTLSFEAENSELKAILKLLAKK